MSVEAQLRSAGAVDLVAPGDAAYDQARQIWNGDIDRRPKLIVRCHGVADVMAAIRSAREHDMLVAIKSGGHSTAGYSMCDDGMVIDLTPLRGILVDPMKEQAVAQAGVLWQELDRESQAFGLATPGGVVSNTGIAGLTLGGGIGWLMGKFGLSVDNVLEMSMVTADGRFVRTNATEYPDLFWALRGGGGNFGIVTSITYKLHKLGPTVLSGAVVHRFDQARDVLRFYREFSADMPDEAQAFLVLGTDPDIGPMVAMLVGYNGDISEGERYFQSLRAFGNPVADTVGPMSHVARQAMLDKGEAEYGPSRYWKSGDVTELSDDFIDTLIAAAEKLPSNESAISLMRISGAVVRVPANATAYGHREEKWDLNIAAHWRDRADRERHVAWARQAWDHLSPMTNGAYVNHLGLDDGSGRIRAAFGKNYDRLSQAKAAWDPNNVFRMNANILPAVGAGRNETGS